MVGLGSRGLCAVFVKAYIEIFDYREMSAILKFNFSGDVCYGYQSYPTN